MKVKKAIIPAAGLGTRFLPATKSQPKEMLPIIDKPTLQYIIEEIIDSGIEDILIITGRGKQAIENHFDKSFELEATLEATNKLDALKEIQSISDKVNVHYVRQKEAKGLGHAVSKARSFVGDEPFALLLGDDVVYSPDKSCLKQLMDKYDEHQCTILGVQEVKDEDVSKYGIVDGHKISDDCYKVKSMVEKPKQEEAPTNMAVLGRYIITPDIFDILDKTDKGAGGEIQLTDALKVQAMKNDMIAYTFKGKRYDIGNKLGFLEATVEFALRRDDLKDEFKAFLESIDK